MPLNTIKRSTLQAASAALFCSVAFAQGAGTPSQTGASRGSPELKHDTVTSFEWDSQRALFAESITAGRDGRLYVSLTDEAVINPGNCGSP